MANGDLPALMNRIGADAAEAARVLAQAGATEKNTSLRAAAGELRARCEEILSGNALDLADARKASASAALLDRLALDRSRIEAMARGLEEIAALPDPVGTLTAEWQRPNGLVIQRVRVPLGVIGIIYESRPNVTADAGALCLKSGNAAILRGGSESLRSSTAIHACLVAGLTTAGLPTTAIQLVPTTDRAAVGLMLGGLDGRIDVLVPRGGKSLVERVRREARVPVIGHLEGNCHVYVDRAADIGMARAIVRNSKLRRTGVCGAAETLLIDAGCAATHLAPIVRDLLEAGCEVRGDAGGDGRRSAGAAGHRGRLADGVSRCGNRRAGGRWRGCRDRAYRALRFGAHRVHRHGRCGRRRALPVARRQRDRAAQRLDAVRRRR